MTGGKFMTENCLPSLFRNIVRSWEGYYKYRSLLFFRFVGARIDYSVAVSRKHPKPSVPGTLGALTGIPHIASAGLKK
jgi:hypothetical protein